MSAGISGRMTPQAALGGIEFHAKAFKGLSDLIRDNLSTEESDAKQQLAGAMENVKAEMRRAYIAARELARKDELAIIEARASKLSEDQEAKGYADGGAA